ncbi:carbon storage regulator [Paenibacillus sp. J5C_2022]|uniref:carbon storage regulator n=1 Tax=Paenibacillus sp. J5C2022 TaxID=2977129 RepID=UPI0021CF0F3A|nr:carbon storage regulator [Paenibacillus sp. J5C2022]MCU6711032.1 carbon storage regulator [Paenibacillus sp. J5C2022]
MNQGVMGLLVLGRKPGESVVINSDIVIKVIKSDDGGLRLAFNAPLESRIVRGELLMNKKN